MVIPSRKQDMAQRHNVSMLNDLTKSLETNGFFFTISRSLIMSQFLATQ
jgi:hypothetical protein